MIIVIGNMIYTYDETGLKVEKKKDQEVNMEDIITKVEDYLAMLADNFEELEDCLEKNNIITKTNELVFWLELYKEKTSQCDL